MKKTNQDHTDIACLQHKKVSPERCQEIIKKIDSILKVYEFMGGDIESDTKFCEVKLQVFDQN